MSRLGTADGKKAIILVPPLEEQKRIVIAIEQTFSPTCFLSQKTYPINSRLRKKAAVSFTM